MEIKITITDAGAESDRHVSMSGAHANTASQSASAALNETAGMTSTGGAIDAGAAPAALSAARSPGPQAFIGHSETAADTGDGSTQSGGAAPDF
ncbi:MAG: hypothetical protein M3Y67_07045 [Pseudomonadota bacterium]|nr:hypothetical protein [Pseudomonadota bacterium]